MSLRSIARFTIAFVALVGTIAAAPAQAAKLQTPEELARALETNRIYFSAQGSGRAGKAAAGRPATETDAFRYLLLDGSQYGIPELDQLHETFARNLPAGMKLIVVTDSDSAPYVQKAFAGWIDKSRFLVVSGDDFGDTLWARDSFPYPVYMSERRDVQLVAHQYYRDFTAQAAIAKSVGAKSVANRDFVYVGGNLLATEAGDCFAVDSQRTFGLPDSAFLNDFRCKSITRLPHVAGIGDVDEVLKPLPNGLMLTNRPEYVAQLQKMGYKVTMLPQAPGNRTYANSVILSKTVFMPSYSKDGDAAAAAVYKSLGFNVIGIPSESLSDENNGSLHCLTMAYPDMDIASLLAALHLKKAF